jgi:L-iditol 2-dehydrogenase
VGPRRDDSAMSSPAPEAYQATGLRRRARVSQRDVVTVVTEPPPHPAPGEALVKILVSGVCGSDKAGVHGEHAFMKPPVLPRPRGRRDRGWSRRARYGHLGRRAEPSLPCGHCKPSGTGFEDLCEYLQFLRVRVP